MDIDGDNQEQAGIKEYWESRSGQPYGPPDAPSPITLYSFGFEADDMLCVYGALRTYLKALAAQDNEDENLMMIQRCASLLIEMKPRAVEASKLLSLKAAGMEA